MLIFIIAKLSTKYEVPVLMSIGKYFKYIQDETNQRKTLYLCSNQNEKLEIWTTIYKCGFDKFKGQKFYLSTEQKGAPQRVSFPTGNGCKFINPTQLNRHTTLHGFYC